MPVTDDTDPLENVAPSGATEPMPVSLSDRQRRRLGLILTLLGSGIFLVWCLNQIEPLPISLPRSFYLHRTLWGGIGMALAAVGWWLQRDPGPAGSPGGRSAAGGWVSKRSGIRFQSVVVYSREGCHLCDDVKELLARYDDYLPEVQEVDIDENGDLKNRFGLVIPVVEIDGRERFRGRIDEGLLRRLIDATPPVERSESH